MIDFWNSLDPYGQVYLVVLLCFIPVMLLGFYAQYKVRSIYKRFSAVGSSGGLTGAHAAIKMLEKAGVSHVPVNRTSGRLTDHYDPKSDSIFLSDSVFNSSSIAAVSIACHEAGHAIQHSENHIFAKIRMFLVPVVNFSSQVFYPLLIIGFILSILSSDPFIGNFCLYLSLVIFSLSTLFLLITLPTEFDASRKAMNFIKEGGSYSAAESKSARKVLTAAAMTYVASFLMSLLQLLRLVLLVLMRTRRR